MRDCFDDWHSPAPTEEAVEARADQCPRCGEHWGLIHLLREAPFNGVRFAPKLSREGAEAVAPGEIVKRIRVELKAAQAAGVIPAFCKFSVRKPDYKSIDVELTYWEGQVFSDEYQEHVMAQMRKNAGLTVEAGVERFTDADFEPGIRGHHIALPKLAIELRGVRIAIERIADRHNYNRSDLQTDYHDVGYWLDCSIRTVEYRAERGLRLECDPKFAKLAEDTHRAIESLHPDTRAKIVESVFFHGVESATEWDMARMIKIADRAKGRPMAYCKRQRGWRVVEKRGDTEILTTGAV